VNPSKIFDGAFGLRLLSLQQVVFGDFFFFGVAEGEIRTAVAPGQHFLSTLSPAPVVFEFFVCRTSFALRESCPDSLPRSKSRGYCGAQLSFPSVSHFHFLRFATGVVSVSCLYVFFSFERLLCGISVSFHHLSSTPAFFSLWPHSGFSGFCGSSPHIAASRDDAVSFSLSALCRLSPFSYLSLTSQSHLPPHRLGNKPSSASYFPS